MTTPTTHSVWLNDVRKPNLESNYYKRMVAELGAEAAKRPATNGDLWDLVGIAVEVIKELQKRVAEIETRGVHYRGVYQRALAYPRGSLVTDGGQMFAALRDVADGEMPLKSDAWQLCVKRGSDAQNRGVIA